MPVKYTARSVAASAPPGPRPVNGRLEALRDPSQPVARSDVAECVGALGRRRRGPPGRRSSTVARRYRGRAARDGEPDARSSSGLRCSTSPRRPRRPRGGRCRRSSSAEDVAQRTRRPRFQIPPASSASVADLAVERLDDLEDRDLVRRAGERVAALDAALAEQQAVPAQGREELLEELDRHSAALGDLGDRDRALARAGELGHRDDRVAGLRGDRDHRSSLVHRSLRAAEKPRSYGASCGASPDRLGWRRRVTSTASAGDRSGARARAGSGHRHERRTTLPGDRRAPAGAARRPRHCSPTATRSRRPRTAQTRSS